MEPNFLVIGAPKAATTSICTNLGKHPDLFMCRPKEPFFFAYDDVYSKGWEWYEGLFSDAVHAKAIGEGSTVYSQLNTFPKTLERIIKHIPNTRVIYSVRHPLERIQSHWIEMHSQGLTMRPFNKAVIEDPQYIDASSYYKNLKSYLQHFPKDRILILFYEEYKNNPQKVLKKCFQFLEINSDYSIEGANHPIYASAGKRSDRPATNLLRKYLPGFTKIRDIAPDSLREIAKKYLKSEISGKPDWERSSLEYVSNILREDTRQFLLYCEKPADYWVL